MRDEVNVLVTVPSCRYVPEMPGFFGMPGVPAHTECPTDNVQPGGTVVVPNGAPSGVALTVYGANPSACTASADALPAGLSMSGLSLSGTATAEGCQQLRVFISPIVG